MEWNFKIQQFDSKIMDYEIKIENLNGVIRSFEGDIKAVSSKFEVKLKEMSKERDELLELTVQRGKLLQV